MNEIYIDGISTRKKISELTGKRNGVQQICNQHGLDATSLNKACLYGKTTPMKIAPYLEARIPIVFSKEPIPSRVINRHSKQTSIFDLTAKDKTKDIKHILIKHLKAMIKELEEV